MLRVFKENKDNNYDYGLKSLRPEARALRKMGIESVQDLLNKFYDGPLTSKTIWKQKLEETKQMQTSAAIRAMRAVIKGIYDERKALKSATWRKTQCEALSKGLLQKLTRGAKGDYEAATLEELERGWVNYGKEAHHSDGILFQLHSVLGRLSLLYREALDELEKRWVKKWYRKPLPQEFYNGYKHHLIEQLAIIELQQTRLTESALARLELVALHRDERRSDVIGETIERLHELKKLKPEFAAQAKVHCQIKPANFTLLHRIVSQEGSETQQRRLNALPWFHRFGNDTDMQPSLPTALPSASLVVKPMDVKLKMALQFGVADSLPSRRKRPAWLFKSHNTRFDFFEDVQGLVSTSLAIQRVQEGSHGDRALANIKQFTQDVAEASLGFTGLNEKINQARAPLLRGLRKYFSKKTQRFLTDIQAKVSDAQVSCQGSIARYIANVTQSVKAGQLVPTENLKNAMTALSKTELCQRSSEALSEALLKFWSSFNEALKRHQQQQSFLKRKRALAELMNPMLTQTPATPADDHQVTTIISTLMTTDERDDLSEYRLELKRTLITQAQAKFKLPALPTSLLVTATSGEEKLTPALEVWQTAMQCFTNHGRVRQAFGTKNDKQEVLKAKLELYRQFLLAFSGGTYARALTNKQRTLITETQAKALLTVGMDDTTQKRILTLQKLYGTKEVASAKRIAKDELKKIERQWYQQTVEAQFEALANRMFNWLQTKHKLLLGPSVVHFLDKLSSDMAKDKCVCVATFIEKMKEGKATAKAFFELNQVSKATAKAFFELNQVSIFTRKSKQNVLKQVVNILAKLKITAHQLPYVVDEQDRAKLLQKLDADIRQEMQRYGEGTTGLTEPVQKHGTFKPTTTRATTELLGDVTAIANLTISPRTL